LLLKRPPGRLELRQELCLDPRIDLLLLLSHLSLKLQLLHLLELLLPSGGLAGPGLTAIDVRLRLGSEKLLKEVLLLNRQRLLLELQLVHVGRSDVLVLAILSISFIPVVNG
jgi:hypothetical protein